MSDTQKWGIKIVACKGVERLPLDPWISRRIGGKIVRYVCDEAEARKCAVMLHELYPLSEYEASPIPSEADCDHAAEHQSIYMGRPDSLETVCPDCGRRRPAK